MSQHHAVIAFLILGLLAACSQADPTPTPPPTPTRTATPQLTPTPGPTLTPTTAAPTLTLAPASPPNLAFSTAEITEEAIRYHRNRSVIVEQFTNAVLDGLTQEGTFESLAATTDGSSDFIDIWYQEGLETGIDFQLGLTSSNQQMDDVAVREIKGNLLLVLRPAPATRPSVGAADPRPARVAMRVPPLRSLGRRNLWNASPANEGLWGQAGSIPRRTRAESLSLGPAGPVQASTTRLRQPLRISGQGDAAIVFGTGEPPGGQLVVRGEQVTLVGKNGSTLAHFEFTGRNMQEGVQEVLDSDVAPPNEEVVEQACEDGALAVMDVNLLSALWDFSESRTSGDQTIEGQRVASLAASKEEKFDCESKERTVSFLISFTDGSTGIQAIAVKIGPSSYDATLTPTPTPTLTPTPTPTLTPTLTPTPTPTLTPTLTPTATPSPTPTPTPTATPPPTPTARPGSVSIGTASCTFVTRTDFGNIGVDEEFDVSISGTVTGPEGATFSLGRVHTAAAQLGFGEFASSWTPLGTLSSARRQAGDAEAATWSFLFRVHTFNDPGQAQSGTIRFTASVTTSVNIAETSLLVTCPWQ